MKPENTNKTNIRICGLIEVFTMLMQTGQGNKPITFYVERNGTVRRLFKGLANELPFTDVLQAVMRNGKVDDLNNVNCRVTTFNDDDMMVITVTWY